MGFFPHSPFLLKDHSQTQTLLFYLKNNNLSKPKYFLFSIRSYALNADY